MAKVRIVTDSTADIPVEIAAALNIAVVPCQVYIGDRVYRDGIDLSAEEFYQELASAPEFPRTSQPPVGEFVRVYRQILDNSADTTIVSLHVASSFSGTVNSAWAAAQQLVDPQIVAIVDSGQLSLGLGLLVIAASRLAATGADRTQILDTVQELLPRARTAALIDTLTNLQQGGRISQISALLGTALQIKPLLSVKSGQVSVFSRVRTRKRALFRLEDHVRNWNAISEMAVLHTGDEESANELAMALQDIVASEHIIRAPAGPALSTHIGLGAVGVCAISGANT